MTRKHKPVANPQTKTQAARKGKAASPWSRYPHCDTHGAALSHVRYVSRGKRLTNREGAK